MHCTNERFWRNEQRRGWERWRFSRKTFACRPQDHRRTHFRLGRLLAAHREYIFPHLSPALTKHSDPLQQSCVSVNESTLIEIKWHTWNKMFLVSIQCLFHSMPICHPPGSFLFPYEWLSKITAAFLSFLKTFSRYEANIQGDPEHLFSYHQVSLGTFPALIEADLISDSIWTLWPPRQLKYNSKKKMWGNL